MNVNCKCNLCSGQIEFVRTAVGQTISCPHCGMETILHSPPDQSSATGNQVNQIDKLIYTNEHVSVNATHLIVGAATFPISAIGSKRIVAIEPNKFTLHWLSTLAGFLLFTAALFTIVPLLDESGHLYELLRSLPFWILGIILAVFAFIVRRRLKPSFGLRVTTTAQEQQVLTSPTIDALIPIESALQQAISMRG